MSSEDVNLAHDYRLSLSSPPAQSSFRVVALLFYELDNDAEPSLLRSQILRNEQGQPYVVGTNDEPCYIGGSICAERAALVQLRFLLNLKRVSKLVISTDSRQPISPGMLCREFLASHSKVPYDLPIVLASSQCRSCGLDVSSNGKEIVQRSKLSPRCLGTGLQHDWACTHTTLQHLYPYPSPYVRLGAEKSTETGESFAQGIESRPKYYELAIEAGLQHGVQELIQVAIAASRDDSRNELHPIQYGAAVLFSDGTTGKACQKKALEYGCTLDAVSQLAPVFLEKTRENRKPTFLVQADQYGMIHPPFAPARAFLVEHGYEKCRVLVPSSNEEPAVLIDVAASSLAPSAPDMGALWDK